MTERVYVVTLNVPESQLSTTLNRVGTDFLAGVSLVKETHLLTPHKATRARTRMRGGSFINGGLTGQALVMQILTSGNRAFSRKELMNAFAEKNFSPHSVNKPLNDLRKSGKVRFVGEGYYTLIQQNGAQPHHV